MLSPFDRDNVIYATLIEQSDQIVAACRAELAAATAAFWNDCANESWNAVLRAREALVAELLILRDLQRALRDVNAAGGREAPLRAPPPNPEAAP